METTQNNTLNVLWRNTHLHRHHKTIQCVILHRVIEFKRKPFPFPGMNTCPIDQQIKHRKKHNTGKIRNHQSHCNRKSLIIEDSSGNATHKNQRSKHGNGSQGRTQHGCHHFTCSCYTGTTQWIAPLPVLDIFSVTIIELSIIIPNARINPDREMIFKDILKR